MKKILTTRRGWVLVFLVIALSFLIGKAYAQELTSRRLLMLCHIEDPQCGPLMAKTYSQALAHPYLQKFGRGPEFKVLCPRGKLPGLTDAAWDFYNELENIPMMLEMPARMAMIEGLEWEMPCP